MSGEIIMTTDVQFAYFRDAKKHPDHSFLNNCKSEPLAMATWSTQIEHPFRVNRCNFSELVLNRILAVLHNHELWLLAAHNSLQEDNRVTRHLKLWRSLIKRQLPIPASDQSTESVQPEGNGVRAYGAMRITLDSLKTALTTHVETSGALVCVPSAIPLDHFETLVADGWLVRNCGPPVEIIDAMYRLLGIVFGIIGEFDDVHAEVIAIGHPSVVEKLSLAQQLPNT